MPPPRRGHFLKRQIGEKLTFYAYRIIIFSKDFSNLEVAMSHSFPRPTIVTEFDPKEKYQGKSGCYRAHIKGDSRIRAIGATRATAFSKCVKAAVLAGFPDSLSRYRPEHK